MNIFLPLEHCGVVGWVCVFVGAVMLSSMSLSAQEGCISSLRTEISERISVQPDPACTKGNIWLLSLGYFHV